MAAPDTSTYLLKNPDVSLPNAQALSSLTSGILKNATNALAIASPTADYLPYNPRLASIAALSVANGDMLLGNGSDAWGKVAMPSSFKSWVCDGVNPPYWGDSGAATASYILAASGSGEEHMPNRRFLTASDGLEIVDGGPESTISINTTGILNSLAGFGSSGILVAQPGGTIVGRSITASSTISVTNPTGNLGNISLDVLDQSSVQNTIYSLNGVSQSTSATLNFVSSPGVDITITPGSDNTTDIYLTGSEASVNVDFVTLTDHTDLLPESFPTSSMTTGIMKVTTGTGVLTTAVAGTDYLAPSANLTSISLAGHLTGQLLVANGTGYTTLSIGSSGQVLTVASGTASWATPATPAPTTSTYILKTADAGLPNALALSTLSTGLVKVTTGTGNLTTAAAGTDYLAPSANLTSISSAANTLGELLVGSGTGYAGLGIGSSGQVLTVSGGTASWQTPSSDAPNNATYILNTPNGSLSSAFALSTLSTGLVKVTTTTGALTTASAGTDYLAPSANLTSISSAANTTGELLVGNGSGYTGLGIGSNGQSLTVVSGTGAWTTPANPGASYIVNTADGSLTSAFALSTLPSGTLQVTTTTGALTSISPNIFVKAIADGTLPSYTYLSGVITFTANGAIGPEYTDNVSTSTSDIIFNYDFAGGNSAYLGAYVITAKGTGGTQEVWTRISTFNSSTNMVAGIKFIPTQGTVYSNSSLTFTTTGAITVGTTPLTFETDAFTRCWVYRTSSIASGSMAKTIAFNLPEGKIFYPTSVFVSEVAEGYTSIPYYFDGTTDTNLGTPVAITGAVSDKTIQYTLDGFSAPVGAPTVKSSGSATQAGFGINVTVASVSPDTPTYTIVGNWVRTA